MLKKKDKVYLGEKYGLPKGLYAKYCRFRQWVFHLTFYEPGMDVNVKFRDWMGKMIFK